MKKILLTVAVTVIVVFGNQSAVRAQGSAPITQSQFNAGENGPMLFQWYIDGSIFFATNGQRTVTTASSMEYATSTAVWSMDIKFNTGSATVTAQTGYDSPIFNWTIPVQIGSQSSITSIALGNVYAADNNESISISGITINGGVPISGTVTAGSSQAFSGLLITDSSPITSLDYTLTVTTPSTWELNNGGNPALLSEVEIPGSVPEPNSGIILAVGSLLFVSVKKLKKF